MHRFATSDLRKCNIYLIKKLLKSAERAQYLLAPGATARYKGKVKNAAQSGR